MAIRATTPCHLDLPTALFSVGASCFATHVANASSVVVAQHSMPRLPRDFPGEAGKMLPASWATALIKNQFSAIGLA
jgi:hypothetical protein